MFSVLKRKRFYGSFVSLRKLSHIYFISELNDILTVVSVLLFYTLEGTNSCEDIWKSLARARGVSCCELLHTQNHLLNVKCCINVRNFYIAPFF